MLTDMDIMSIVACNTYPHQPTTIQLAVERFGQPYKTEGQAYWFHATGSIYGIPLRDMFISVSTQPRFVGVVFSEAPQKVVDAVEAAPFLSTHLSSYGQQWEGLDGRTVNWQEGKYAKMFCSASGV